MTDTPVAVTASESPLSQGSAKPDPVKKDPIKNVPLPSAKTGRAVAWFSLFLNLILVAAIAAAIWWLWPQWQGMQQQLSQSQRSAQQLEQQLQALQDEQQQLDGQRAALDAQAAYIDSLSRSNQPQTSGSNTLSPQQWPAAWQVIGEGMRNIGTARVSLNQHKRDLDNRLRLTSSSQRIGPK